MHDEIEFMPLQHGAAEGAAGADLKRLHDVPVELAVEIGRTRMTIGQTLELRPGSVVSLNRLAGEPVDLLVNGKPIARGEVVVIDEEFGLRITDVVSSRDVVDEAALAAHDAAQAEAELLAHLGGEQVEDASVAPAVAAPVVDDIDPLGGHTGPAAAAFAGAGDSLADASVDDIPLGGMPTPDELR